MTVADGNPLREANFDRYEALNRPILQSAAGGFQGMLDSVLPTLKGIIMSLIIRPLSFADSDNATTGETVEVSVRHDVVFSKQLQDRLDKDINQSR